ncbi:MAG: hypothetical protein DRO63_06070 [Candidatus Gerdarchaeota archaeon]|nr:MAG: hypothetical protein DRO63_06070 [Candidatus Gerdarchaeota archaeon]
MQKKAKIVFQYDAIRSDLKLEEIVALISTGDRNSPEYGLTYMILKKITSGKRFMTKRQTYELYMKNREHISKASYYRILKRLIERGMIVYNEQEEKYQPAIFFSNALHRLAFAWEAIVVPEKQKN